MEKKDNVAKDLGFGGSRTSGKKTEGNMLIKSGVDLTCAWHESEGSWETDCGHGFIINEGTPKGNDMNYCCYCGRVLDGFPEEEQKC